MDTVQFEMKLDLPSIWKIMRSLRIVRVLLSVLTLCVAAIISMAVLAPEVRVTNLVAITLLVVIAIFATRHISHITRDAEVWGHTIHVVVGDTGLLLYDVDVPVESQLIPWSDLPTAKEHSEYYELRGPDGTSGPVLPKRWPLDPRQAGRLHELLALHTALS